MKARTIVVNVFTVDSADIGRTPAGAPHIDGHTRQARLYLATRAGDGTGWLLETWQENQPHDASQHVGLVLNIESLAADIAAAVQAIATDEE